MIKENENGVAECNNQCKLYMHKETCEYCKKNRIVSNEKYEASRYHTEQKVRGYLVKDKKGEVLGILNENTHYAELAYIKEETLAKLG